MSFNQIELESSEFVPKYKTFDTFIIHEEFANSAIMVSSEQLLKLLDFNLSSKNFENAVKLLDDEAHGKVILSHYPELIQDVLLKYLTSDNHKNESKLYKVCESILKLLADKCHQEGILFEFLEIIESTNDDNVFTSTLKCLQVILLKQSEKKTRSLEYCLNSIEDYIVEKLPLPNLVNVVEEEEEKILDNDESVQRVLLMYMTLEMFYEPIVSQMMTGIQPGDDKVFRCNKFNRENVLFGFILRLLGKPLAHLDLSHDDEKKVSTYSRSVAEKLVKTIVSMDKNVFRLLEYAERRCRWPTKTKIDDDLDDIFLHPEKVPLLQVGMLFYLIIAEGVEKDSMPKVYRGEYIFSSCIYLVNEMLKSDHPVIFKGLKLLSKLLQNVNETVPADELGLTIHKDFCSALIKVLIFSQSKRNRENALKCLKSYILKFDSQGRYLLISNILKMSDCNGLIGYLTVMYKDMIVEEMKSGQTSMFMSGSCMKKLLLNHFCKLQGGVQCNVQESSDQIMSSLNFLNVMLQFDKKNITGIKDLIGDLEKGFLDDLRKALDLSRAHFEEEINNVKSGKNQPTKLLEEIEVLNGDNYNDDITEEMKLGMLKNALLQFHLIDCHLARVNEIINSLK